MGIAALEAALIAPIKAALGNKVRTVESLPGNFDDNTFKRLLRQVPGIFITWAGAQTSSGRDGGVAGMTTGLWIVYVVTGHASGEAARRLGDSQQVGAYELVDTLVPLLNGLTIKGEGTLSLTRVENLYSGTVDSQGLSLYAMQFNMPMAWPTTVDEATLTPFQTFDAQYDIPELTTDAEHKKWLAGDYGTTKPDARDTVAVPQ